MWKVAIFGAKSIALGACIAMQQLYKDDFEIIGFLVSSKADNPDTLLGLPVYELDSFPQKDICILVATPEDVHGEIVKQLEQQGFHNHICVDSRKEARLMEQYYADIGIFQSIHKL